MEHKGAPIDITLSTRNTTASGDLAELEIAAALVRDGRKLLRPMSSASRYDLVIDNEDGTFTRVQCKCARTMEGRLEFRLYSISGHTPVKKGYAGQVDAFGVYCRESRRTFLVPVAAIGECETIASLRMAPTKNGQRRGVRAAEDFEIGIVRGTSLFSGTGPPNDQHGGGEAVQEIAAAYGAELAAGEEPSDGDIAVGAAEGADVMPGLTEETTSAAVAREQERPGDRSIVQHPITFQDDTKILLR